jgi:hypothetical protein
MTTTETPSSNEAVRSRTERTFAPKWSHPNADAISAGREAWQRLCRRGDATFADWIVVGQAVAIGRAECLKRAGTNKPFGKKYTAAMAEWLLDAKLDDIHQQERYWALRVIDNLEAIEGWRATLDDKSRRRLSHPQAIWGNWRKSLGESPRHPVRGAVPQATGRAIHWPQDVIRRAAVAMRECRSPDVYVLARVALEAAIRTDSELMLLFATPRSDKRAAAPATDRAALPAHA